MCGLYASLTTAV